MKRTDATATYRPMCEPICEPITGRMANRTLEPEDITISCYENDVPAFVEANMNRLYGNLYSSLAQFRIYGNGRETSTYIVRRGGRTITVFLFQHNGGNVRILNQVISIDEVDITRFSAYIFANFKSVTSISFDYIHTNLRTLPFPYQRINISEDIVLSLPATTDEYLASLGKNTRRNVKRYTKKLLDTYPSFQFEVFAKDDIDGQAIQDIINLNRARMVGKDKVSAIDELQTERTIRLAAECGLVCVARIDGRVCAGSICFQTGSNYFFSVIAHDPKYDDCCLGYLCSYRTICECIAREGNEFHFLWGEYEYKYSLLGVKRDLEKIAIYRSHAYLLLNVRLVLSTAFEGFVRKAILWLHKAKRQDSLVSRVAIASLKLVRRLRRLGDGLATGRKEEALGQSQE